MAEILRAAQPSHLHAVSSRRALFHFPLEAEHESARTYNIYRFCYTKVLRVAHRKYYDIVCQLPPQEGNEANTQSIDLRISDQNMKCS